MAVKPKFFEGASIAEENPSTDVSVFILTIIGDGNDAPRGVPTSASRTLGNYLQDMVSDGDISGFKLSKATPAS